MAKMSKAERVRQYLSDHPKAKAADVARVMKTSPAYVYAIRNKLPDWLKTKPLKPKNKWVMSHVTTSDNSVEENDRVGADLEEMIKTLTKHDSVNQPAHYKVGGIETIDFIEAKELNYHLGNVVKYIARAEHKGDRMENLMKAQWYLDREIENMQVEQAFKSQGAQA